MRRIVNAGVALAVALPLMAAYAGTASAHELHAFLWTGPLPFLPALLLGIGEGLQTFTTGASVKIECESLKLHGFILPGSTKVLPLKGQYTNCTALGGPAIVSPVEFELGAEEWLTISGKPIVITVPGAGCSIKIKNGGLNKTLKRVSIFPKATDLLLSLLVGNVDSESSGGECGAVGIQEGGFFTGFVLLKADSAGILGWH
ncbi:MAG TPA: hypothetical protein VFY36_09020 [Solirubrobacteraceae bacterium]|nr:hypothetical protein [Solirubrobacteraceae bacterium]